MRRTAGGEPLLPSIAPRVPLWSEASASRAARDSQGRVPATSREIRAIQAAIASSVIGVATKLSVGILTGSMSMISSAADSMGDIVVSTANLFVVRIAARAPDEDHNYGHAKAEGLGAMFEGGFIFAAAVFVIYASVRKILEPASTEDSTLGILVMVPILGITVATVAFMRRIARETGSLVVKTDALHYESDIWLNGGVLVALVLVKLTGRPIIDPIIAICIALNMFRASYGVVREGVAVVMDESLEPAVVAEIRTVLASAPGIESFHDLKTRVGKIPFVDFHVVVAGDTTTHVVHELYLELRRQIREVVGPTTQVLMHADPSPSSSPSAAGSDAEARER